MSRCLRLTEAELARLTGGKVQAPVRRPDVEPHKVSAGWREIGAVRKHFRSRWEANFARYLQFLKDKGEIRSWEHEPKTFWFDAKPSRHLKGIRRGCVSYKPDFRVVDRAEKEIWYEVKGWMDPKSATKIRRMAKYHPSVTLIVVSKREYSAMKRDLSGMVPGWE